MTQTKINQWEIDVIISAINYAHNLGTQGETKEKTVKKVLELFDAITSPSAGIYMPTELYEKMIKEGI